VRAKKQAEQATYSMTKYSYIFDVDTYPVAWRFNSNDCLLSDQEKASIILFNEPQSQRLWDAFIPTKNLMELTSNNFKRHEKSTLSFSESAESAEFFKFRLNEAGFIWFFWGGRSAAIVPKDIFIKAWDDFFYPSDEDSLLLVVNSSKAIYSFEDTFFYGDLLTPGTGLDG
jgi:hypothetical protein